MMIGRRRIILSLLRARATQRIAEDRIASSATFALNSAECCFPFIGSILLPGRTKLIGLSGKWGSAQIDRVVLTPSPAGAGLSAGLHGELAGVLAVCEGAAQMGKAQTHERPGSFEPGRRVSVVAGAGFEPAAFRL